MAIVERWLAQHFNRPGHEIINHFTYSIVSDGDLMEGISHEAASLAGHLRLGATHINNQGTGGILRRVVPVNLKVRRSGASSIMLS
jgi:hypothetical protein